MGEPIDGPSLPWLHERARRQAETPALVFAGRETSFAALARASEEIAGRLAALGVERGDRVAVVMDASPRFVALVHAAQRLGAVLAPLSTRLTTAEIASLVEDAAPRVVLHDAAHGALLAAVRGSRQLEAGRELDAVRPVRLESPLPVDPNAVLTLLYTSGTTGRPKGAMLTNGNYLATAAASRARLGIRSDDRWLALLPLHHVGGLSILARGVLDGVPIVLHRGFDPAGANRTISADGITLLSVVATMLRRMLETWNGSARRLRCVLVGGGPAPQDLLVRAAAAGLPVAPTYGLTEAASQVATASTEEALDRPGTSGRALPGTHVRIDAPDGGGLGEILVRGPTVMAGYFARHEATAESLRDGWLHTGDVGRIDDAGYLYVFDRRSDLIVTGGENVYPAEVEAVLLAHPLVREVAVFPLPDAEWGQRVAAAVVLREIGSVDGAALVSWCAARLARFKLPRTVEFLPELPRTASGKIRRHELAADRSRRPS